MAVAGSRRGLGCETAGAARALVGGRRRALDGRHGLDRDHRTSRHRRHRSASRPETSSRSPATAPRCELDAGRRGRDRPGPRRSSRSSPPPPTPAYGISTGFGALATRHIPTEMRAQLQRSLVRSHAAGSGPEVEREVVRGADAAAALDAGDRAHRRPPRDRAAAGRRCSAHGITPVVHEYGSLGCSGDLAPLVALRAGADGRGRRSATRPAR